MSIDTAVVIIGAGPAGLATSALLKYQSIDHVLLDKADSIGGAYARMRTSLQLLSPTYFNSLPLRKGDWEQKKISAGDYLTYLQNYAKALNIEAQLNLSANAIEKTVDGYLVTCHNGPTYRCRFVVHAIGTASFPRRLALNIGQDSAIQLQHCIDVDDTKDYQGKHVLIIGSGTSALETAMLLVPSSQVTLLANKPLSILGTSFMDIDIHYWIRPLEKLPRLLHHRACSGRWHEPALCDGARQAIKAGAIRVQRGAVDFQQNRAQFADGSASTIDYVINCSGYRYDDGLLPRNIRRNSSGNIATRHNESVSHAGLFLIGYRCANSIDSGFLRGIRCDAGRIAASIARALDTTELD